MDRRERKIRKRLRDDLHYYSRKNLKILQKPSADGERELLVPFRWNAAQAYIDERLNEQLATFGWVRAIVLKGRQQGVSTYIGARFYARTTQRRGVKTYIMTHQAQATDNLFAMVQRFQDNASPILKPHVGKSNAKELVFDRLDSRYQVATAGSKGAGRSATLHLVHGSEVAFWDNAKDHLAGMLQAVPGAPGTEVVFESTANGKGNMFHRLWQQAEQGQGDFIAIFVPWFWQPEYRIEPPDDFMISDSQEDTPEGQLTEAEYQRRYKLTAAQMWWRRKKISELGGGDEGFFLFKQEYPANAAEAFEASSSGSLIGIRAISSARKADVRSDGSLVVGVDPARFGDDQTAIIRRRARTAYGLKRFSKLNTMQVAMLVHRIIEREQPVRVFVDVGGLGAGVVDRLMELEGTQGIVTAINFGSAANDPEMYKNLRAQMWWEMRDWLDDPAGVSIPDDDALESDLLAPGYTYTSSQQRQLESKEQMRKRGIRSPDSADALALTFAMPVGRSADQVGDTRVEIDDFNGHIIDGAGDISPVW